jgi:GNAT superfamily N-acetyltransferase
MERPRPMEARDLPLALRFDCGVTVLNQWLQNYAWQNHRSGAARIYLAIDKDLNGITGYYCLSAAQVERENAPKRVSQGLAQHPIPVVLIGRFAVDRRSQGSGLGRFLIAFERVFETADLIGIRAVMVRAKDASAAAFYTRLGFQVSASDPMLFFHLLKDIRRSLDAARKS